MDSRAQWKHLDPLSNYPICRHLSPDQRSAFRAGKQRIPFYFYSETVDVGATFDFARLPTEMYSISSNNDFTGLRSA